MNENTKTVRVIRMLATSKPITAKEWNKAEDEGKLIELFLASGYEISFEESLSSGST